MSLLYVVFMSTVGGLMLIESLRAVHKHRKGKPAPMRRGAQHTWVHRLPLRTRFPASKLYISTIPPLGLGLLVGFFPG